MWFLCLLPFHELQVQDEYRVEHRHEEQCDECRHTEAADLGVTHRLPQWATVRCQGKQRDYRGAHCDQDRSQTYDARVEQRFNV